MSKIRCFDCHFHIIDDRFPLYRNQGFLPSNFLLNDYTSQIVADPRIDVVSGAIVSASYQKFDQTYLVDALKKLNNFGDKTVHGKFVGVTQLESLDDDFCMMLDDVGVRAIRFNLARGVTIDVNEISCFANHLHQRFGWHAEFYLDTSLLHEDKIFMELLCTLPTTISIDHCGLTARGQTALLELMQRRHKEGRLTYVKLTGFGRYQGTQQELETVLEALLTLYPRYVMFATDLPCTRAQRPYMPADVELLLQCLANVYRDIAEQQVVIEQVFYRNAMTLYSPDVSKKPVERSTQVC